MIYSEEQLTEKYNTLPQDVRDAIFNVDLEKQITDIGEKYSLHIDQIGELMEAVQFVMLGILPSKDFIRNLYDRLEIQNKEKVRAIARDVNELVFAKIKESLKQIHKLGIMNQESGIMNKELTNLVVPPPSNGGVVKENTTETKEKIAENIESPEKEEKDIIKEKLESMNIMPKSESEYEIKTDGNNNKKSSTDPYREPIA
jgi:hypothetical protein